MAYISSFFSRLRRFRPEQIFLIVQGVLGGVAILPFAVWRLGHKQWMLGLIDLVIVFSLLGFALYGTLGRHFRLISLLFGLTYAVGQLVIVTLRGPEAIYWAFPVAAAIFFVVRVREAFWIALLSLLGNTWLAFHSVSFYETLTFFSTDLLVCVYAYIFSEVGWKKRTP